MAISKQEIQAAYDRRAKNYDRAVQLYRLIGLHIETYRSRVVELLHLKQGDCVVDLGCGTGLNFSRVVERIGSEGRLIGVDLSAEMLGLARERVERSGWQNVELIQSDMAIYDFPESVNAVLSTGAFGFVPEYEQVIEKVSHALVPGGRLVICDGKKTDRWPSWLVKLFVRISRPFGVTFEYFERRLWEVVERLFEEMTMEEIYGGMMYISAGTAPSRHD